MSESTTPKQGIVTFWLPSHEKEALEAISARDERSVSAILRLLVREYLRGQDQAA